MPLILAVSLCLILASCASLAPPSSDDAEPYYRELTVSRPEAAEPWFKLGNIQVENGQLEAAEYAYRQALKRAAMPKALHNLGLVQIRLGIKALREARGRMPADHPVHRETQRYLEAILASGL